MTLGDGLERNVRVLEFRTGSDTEEGEKALSDVLGILAGRTGHDFRHYKRATVLRRVERRMQVNAVSALPDYRDLESRAELALHERFGGDIADVSYPVFRALREAIEEANFLVGSDSITFTVSGVITKDAALSPFLTVTEAVLIDGESSPPFVSTPVVTLNGFALELRGPGGSEVRGLEIVASPDNGIYIDTDFYRARTAQQRHECATLRGGSRFE